MRKVKLLLFAFLLSGSFLGAIDFGVKLDSMIQDGDDLFVITDGSNRIIRRMDPVSGNILWYKKFKTKEIRSWHLTLEELYLIVKDRDDSTVVCIDRKNGEMIWTQKMNRSDVVQWEMKDDTILLMARGSSAWVYSFDRFDGTLLWHKKF